MKKDNNIKSYTAAELKAKRAESRTDLSKVDAMADEKLERLIAEDEDERGIRPGLKGYGDKMVQDISNPYTLSRN